MRQRFSTIWNYFDLFESGKSKNSAYGTCKYCSKTFGTQNTTSMFLHLKANHEDVYLKALDDRKRHPIRRRPTRKTTKPKPKPRKQKSRRKKSSHQKPVSTKSSFITESKNEPKIIYENELLTVSDNSNTSFIEVVNTDKSVSPLLLPLQVIENDSLAIYAGDCETEEKDEGQVSFPQMCVTRRVSYSNIEESKSDESIANVLSSLSSDVKSIKDTVSNKDQCFYLSVAAELDVMPEESKDLVKAAIWHVICEVKRAKRKNIEVSLLNIFK